MTTLDRLHQWRETGAISAEQYEAIRALVRKDRFSVFLELNILLYLGVLALAVGIGATVQKYFSNLSDAAVLLTLSSLLAGSMYYCFSRTTSYSNEAVESPTLAFDYVLYFACLVLTVLLGYIEFRFEILKDQPDVYFAVSSVVFFVLAYRFDNRFVLSLALSSLAGAFGLRVTRLGVRTSDDPLRMAALIYSALIVTTGVWLSRAGLKEHFLETYLHIAANVTLFALASGVTESGVWPAYLLALITVAVLTIFLGVRHRRFAFVVYGTLYGYIGLSIRLLQGVHDEKVFLSYLVVTGSAVIAGLVILARRFGRGE